MNALLMVDIQNDFLPGGSLPVAEGDIIVPVVNKLQPYFELVIATQDWHPANHGSFASNHPNKKPGDIVDLDGAEQVLWPDHCVQHTTGANFADELHVEKLASIIKKGTDARIDSYSGFYDNLHKKATGLHAYLTWKKADTLTITGLAADICVRYSTLDALELGYNTYLVKDATKAVGGEDKFNSTLLELETKGAKIVTSDEMIRILGTKE